MTRPHCKAGHVPTGGWASVVLLAVCLPNVGVALEPATSGIPAITDGQLEADWGRQQVVRNDATTLSGKSVEPAADATGGCDGVKDGKWGFHTENEDQPWWQVDLGASLPLERVVLFNRSDTTASRNARIRVLLSDDGRQFREVYQHDGTVFLGHPDKKPLVVKIDGQSARYVRVQLPGTSYLHLDEVEVYAAKGKQNVALHKPATQSSTSQWSVRHERSGPGESKFDTEQVVERGLKLAGHLRELGAEVSADAKSIDEVVALLKELPKGASVDARRELDHRARRAVRRMALSNPLLDFDEILFLKRAPGLFPHVSDQYYGWWSRGGGGICVLSGFKGDNPRVRCLTEDWPKGSFLRPDLSYDGRKVLFAWCKYHPHVANIANKTEKEKLPEDAFYHVFEMNVDGSGVRQLTHGYYDDFDARYLPSGEIVFLSTRKGQALQAGKQSALATAETTCPDSYVRCGGGNHRPVAVFTLHTMNAAGKNLRAISAFENFEWTPAVDRDGRILYARWDYIDRHNGSFMSLWSTNPDGTNPQLVFGNYTKRPQCVFEAQPIPNSRKLLFTATAHHSITGGSLALLDPNMGTEYERPLTRLTPEVPFPETEGWPKSYYVSPHPLSEQHFLVAWSDRPLPAHRLMPPDDPRNPRNALGLYLYDAFGNLTLLHRDPAISSMNPLPIRPRRRPPAMTDTVDWAGPQEGRFLLQDVYEGMPGVERGAIESLRVIGVPPKVQPQMNNPVLGVSHEDPGKFVLGTVPVEKDGSAFFRVPSGIPVLFQALDKRGMAMQTMRSLTYVQPNQTLACIGCHESRQAAPGVLDMPLAAKRAPSRLKLGPVGSWPLRFDELVQPVLDARCVSCHKAGVEHAQAAAFDLTPRHSYESLLGYADGDLRKLAFEKDYSEVGDCPSRQSKLLQLVTAEKSHHGVRLQPKELERLTTWMDTYAHRQGSYSPRQEEQLRALKRALGAMLEE